MRFLRTCHALAMLCWWGGFVVLAVLLITPYRYHALQENLPQLVDAVIWAWGHQALRAENPNAIDLSMVLHEATTAELLGHVHVWLPWSRSPLNIHYWGIAMLCFTPALFLTLLTRHLDWRRQH